MCWGSVISTTHGTFSHPKDPFDWTGLRDFSSPSAEEEFWESKPPAQGLDSPESLGIEGILSDDLSAQKDARGLPLISEDEVSQKDSIGLPLSSPFSHSSSGNISFKLVLSFFQLTVFMPLKSEIYAIILLN